MLRVVCEIFVHITLIALEMLNLVKHVIVKIQLATLTKL